MVLFCFSGKLGVEKTMRVVARLPTASFGFTSLVEDIPRHPGVPGHRLNPQHHHLDPALNPISPIGQPHRQESRWQMA